MLTECAPVPGTHQNVVDGGLIDDTAIVAAVRNGANRVIALGAQDLTYAMVKMWADKPDSEWARWVAAGIQDEESVLYSWLVGNAFWGICDGVAPQWIPLFGITQSGVPDGLQVGIFRSRRAVCPMGCR